MTSIQLKFYLTTLTWGCLTISFSACQKNAYGHESSSPALSITNSAQLSPIGAGSLSNPLPGQPTGSPQAMPPMFPPRQTPTGFGSPTTSPAVSPKPLGPLQNPKGHTFSPNLPPVQSGGGGGLDGSGGDQGQSTIEEVQVAVAEEIGWLPTKLRGLELRHYYSGPTIYDSKFGESAYSLMSSFLNRLSPNERASSLRLGLEAKKIEIKTQLERCLIADESHAGSAKGNFEKGEICISLEMLKNTSTIALHEEIFALLIHELSHLVGFDESRAVQIQKLIILHPGTYSEERSINNFTMCNSEKTKTEVKSMQASSYWNKQFNIFLSLLSAPLSTGDQSQIDDFDPAEWGPGRSKKDPAFIFNVNQKFLLVTAKFAVDRDFKPHPSDQPIPPAHINAVQIRSKNNSNLAGFNITTATGGLQFMAKFGTNAECSHKVLLANLIANIPDALEIQLGNEEDRADKIAEINSLERIEARIRKEKEILAGE